MIDVKGNYIFLGGIDFYIYLDMLFGGIVIKDDFEIGIRVVVFGGMIIVIDFCLINKGELL